MSAGLGGAGGRATSRTLLPARLPAGRASPGMSPGLVWVALSRSVQSPSESCV